MKNPRWNPNTRILKFTLLGWLLAGTAVLAAPPSSSPILSFTANPSTITAGQTTTLSWVVEGAKSVTLSGVSATPASSAVVAPTHTTTYTLTVKPASGKRVSQEVTVSVTADPSIGTAVIDAAHPGDAIPAGFLGFSHEWGQAQLLMGDPAIGTNPIYRQLLDNLTAYGGGPISLRIGGNTTDSTALPDAGTVSPFAALFKDQRHDHKDGVFFYLGVNLGSDSVALATSQAQVFVQNMPKILSLIHISEPTRPY